MSEEQPTDANKGSKSLLSGMKVKEEGFPLNKEHLSKTMLGIVGACPSCGAPIFGDKVIAEGDQPRLKHSCNCWRRQGIVEQKMEHETK